MTLTVQEIRSRVATRRTRAAAPRAVPVPLTPAALPTPVENGFTSAALVIAIASLGLALQVNFGQFHPRALAWLTAALLACLAAVVLPNRGTLRPRSARLLAGAALAGQFLVLLTTNPAATLRPDHLLAFRLGLLSAGGLTALALIVDRPWRAVAIVLMLLAHFLLGAWVLRATPHPPVDVYAFQEQACAALLRGENPYAITFPDPNPAAAERFYAPGTSVNGRLQFGYPYPPLTLWMALPGHVLAGDFRWSQLIALTLAGGLIAFASKGRMSIFAAALLLFTPRGFFVLEAGWTEPFVVLLLALTVFLASRPRFGRSLALPMALGLFLASKQYLVLAVPLLPLLWNSLARASSRMLDCSDELEAVPGIRGVASAPHPAWRALAIAFIAAALVSLPLVLWNVPAFLHSAVALQFHQPFRPDALSYLVPLSTLTDHAPPAWVAFAFALPATALCLRRCPRTPAGFALALSLTFLVFFAFNKQAFCNYYYFVLGGLCCALATLPTSPEPNHRPQPY